MSGNGDNWQPDDLGDLFDDVPLQEWERIRREYERQRATREAERRLEGKHISEIVHLAREGDKAAQSLAMRQASRLIYTGKPLPPPLNSYISASLRRRADGTTWAKAFTPETEGKRERQSLLKAGKDAMIVAVVDLLAEEGLSKKAPDGSPGPAFIEAGNVFCLSPSRVRERYYEHKSALDRLRKMGKKRESP